MLINLVFFVDFVHFDRLRGVSFGLCCFFRRNFGLVVSLILRKVIFDRFPRVNERNYCKGSNHSEQHQYRRDWIQYCRCNGRHVFAIQTNIICFNRFYLFIYYILINEEPMTFCLVVKEMTFRVVVVLGRGLLDLVTSIGTKLLNSAMSR